MTSIARTDEKAARAEQGASASSRVVELDVRPDLRAGREPFGRIMATVQALRDGEELLLRATFEPVPLFHVLMEQGFRHEATEHGPQDWSVRFWKPQEKSASQGPDVPAVSTPSTQPMSTSSAPVAELDVRVIPPRDKHPTIFRTLEALKPGEALLLLNDHDPRPLRYQLMAERPDSFEWTYQDEGPEVWRVRIYRK